MQLIVKVGQFRYFIFTLDLYFFLTIFLTSKTIFEDQ